jgi:RNA-binding protein YhbY
MSSAPRIIPEVVDEIAFQTRRNLAQHALVDVIPFSRDDEEAIREGARRLAQGRSAQLPPRHLVSAAHQALEASNVAPQALAQRVIRQLTEHLQTERTPTRLRLAA